MQEAFELVNVDGTYAVLNKHSVVSVLVYTLDENGVLDKIGAVTEPNPHFPNGIYTGPVMGKVEADDKSLLSRAKQETLEETGYEVIETERWSFLGEMITSKLLPGPVYCYSVDVTGIQQGEIKGDGSEQEANLKFELLDLNKASEINDTILQTCFFKLFNKLYKKDLIDGTTQS
jgi:8-oxo-dGTP pyrophosphatase MutT (NUDIX family)